MFALTEYPKSSHVCQGVVTWPSLSCPKLGYNESETIFIAIYGRKGTKIIMKKWIAFGAVMVLALVIAACGANNGGNESGGAAAVNAGVEPTSEIVMKASNYEFDQQEYQIKAGEPTAITLKSVGSSVHGAQILKSDYKIGNNKTVTVQFDEPGTYDIICNVACGTGHAKMRAKLVVS